MRHISKEAFFHADSLFDALWSEEVWADRLLREIATFTRFRAPRKIHAIRCRPAGGSSINQNKQHEICEKAKFELENSSNNKAVNIPEDVNGE